MTRIEMEQRLRRVLTARGLERPAYAIVLPVIWTAGGAELLVEVRAAGIPQAGDPCFPGGRIEPGETPARAAARELEEETGLYVPPERFLGQIPTVHTVLGGRTNAFVCTAAEEEADAVRANPAEVSELLRAPVRFFLERPDAASYPVGGHVIWGMTAGAIHHFCDAWKSAGLPV